MLRGLALAVLLAVLPAALSGQAIGVLHVTVVLTDASGAPMPVPRHGLLISDNPPTAAPRLVVTGPDGTVDVRLRPGSYIVESDEPVALGGRGYQWTKTVDLAAGQSALLALTAENADVGDAPAPSSAPEAASAKADNPSLLLPRWKDSVVSIWTAGARGSGFVIDAAGLVVTSQPSVGSASTAEVQLTPAVKVAARILAIDRARGVAVLRIDAGIAGSGRPLPLGCDDNSVARPALASGERLAAIGAPLRGQTDVYFGEVVRADTRATAADFRLASGSSGGPVFGSDGRLVGISSVENDQDARRLKEARVVPVADVCEVVRSAETAMRTTSSPSPAHLPVEPLKPFPAAALDAAFKRRLGSLNPYQISTPDFDVAFITPVQIYGAQQREQQASLREGRIDPTHFGDWSDYFVDTPPVLVIRVTPRLTEGFWTTVGRAAASTQGVALPAIKHFKPGFSALHVFCGDVEVLPIHPFILDQRVSESDAVREGLYVFDPGALGPHCAPVKVVLSSEKAPETRDTMTVEPKVIEQIWQDFAPYRE